jgi:hypothetical protein
LANQVTSEVQTNASFEIILFSVFSVTKTTSVK